MTGLDRLAAAGFAALKGQRVGLLVHPASVDGLLRHALDLFLEADNVQLKALFGPQHGILGQTQDNMIEWEGFTDPRTGLPVYSALRRASAAHRADARDPSTPSSSTCRTSAPATTPSSGPCCCACARAPPPGVKRVVVLDRPNPLGAVAVAGTVLRAGWESFVGLAPLPMRHGMTIGELAHVPRTRRRNWTSNWRSCGCEGWRRDDGLCCHGPALGPALAQHAHPRDGLRLSRRLPAGGHGALSEGRGTTRPFEICGAPYIDPDRLIAELAGEDLAGLRPAAPCSSSPPSTSSPASSAEACRST
jgi:uncharacterized protein YbbC (DUF1343 family)